MLSHEKGKQLELDICEEFKRIGVKASRTPGSGNKGSVGDINNNFFGVEAKYRNTKDITIKEDVWRKLKKEIPLHSERVPLHVIRNKNDETFAVLKLSDFMDILQHCLMYEGEI